nr:sensor histidine kinase [Amycolatopsis jiangsuensis]
MGEQGPNKSRWPVLGVLFLLPYLVPATQAIAEDPGPLLPRVLFALLSYTYAACYLLFPLVFGRSRRGRYVFGCGMLALGLPAALLPGMSPYILLYATATLVFVFPPAWALILDGTALGVAALVLFARGWQAGDGGDLVSVVSVTAAMFFMANLVRAVRRLKLANQEIATLAVANERERVARDLHDLLGHSLTTISVKAGAARRVLEASADIPRAVREIREVEGLTRTALTDVRATVSEYRTVSLPAEIAGARAALRAAEIEADLPHAVDHVRAELQSTFGYVLREAITNVLRHSDATRVCVRLGQEWLEIDDDGKTGENAALGNGLRGLTERMGAAGGTLRAHPRSGGGWRVRAEVPEPDETGAVVRAQPAGGFA